MSDCDLLRGPWCSHGPPLQLLRFSADGLYWLSDKILNLVMHFLECVNESGFKNLCRQTSKSRFCAGLFPLSCFSFQVISRLICFDRLLSTAHERLLVRLPSLGICSLRPTGCSLRQELRGEAGLWMPARLLYSTWTLLWPTEL